MELSEVKPGAQVSIYRMIDKPAWIERTGTVIRWDDVAEAAHVMVHGGPVIICYLSELEPLKIKKRGRPKVEFVADDSPW